MGYIIFLSHDTNLINRPRQKKKKKKMEVRSMRRFIEEKFGSFLDKILELWPDDITTANCSNLGPVYAKILSYMPSVTRSDEDKMGTIIANDSRQEKDLRLAFLTVIINHFYYDYLENENAGSDESNLSRSGSITDDDDESDDSNFTDNSQDAYQPNGDESSSTSSSEDLQKSSKKNVFKQKLETATNALSWIEAGSNYNKKKYEKYAQTFKSLVLGVDKAIMYLYPFMSKPEKDVFNTSIIDARVMRKFKTILKDNITFLRSNTLPIEKNIKAKNGGGGEDDAVGAYLTESDNPVIHVSKKQKK